MSQFFESIKIKEGKAYNLDFHFERMNKTAFKHFGVENISNKFELAVPPKYKKGVFKLRIEYDAKITKIEFVKYEIRKIKRLKLVADKNAKYNFKKTDRSFLDKHLKYITTTTDILISKNGFIKEASFANVCLLKDGIWYTPANPLHNGTKRKWLIKKNKVKVKKIKTSDIKKYSQISLINALLDIGDISINTSKIDL